MAECDDRTLAEVSRRSKIEQHPLRGAVCIGSVGVYMADTICLPNGHPRDLAARAFVKQFCMREEWSLLVPSSVFR